MTTRFVRRFLLCAAAVCVAGCASARPFPAADPVWVDPDRHPFGQKPDESFSPLVWDGMDRTFFQPHARFFAVESAGESVNVNALDEVPDSSWFENRIGRFAMSPEQVAIGPCDAPPPDPNGPWTIISGKHDGVNPGFVIETNEGRRYLIKFDGGIQGPRATAAEAIVSRIYYAAGYSTPCNRVVFFDRSILKIATKAKAMQQGDEVRFGGAYLDKVLEKAIRLPDGRYRASASRYLPGEPLGPWKYDGTRCDDPNDVVDHEDRRELRGSKLLAAWVEHFDTRDQNTLATWMDAGSGRGWVEHHLLDFAASFGSAWEPPAMARRIGDSYWLDFGHIGADFFTLGLVERSWRTARFGPTGRVFAYFDVEHFDAEGWRPNYPNPAFGRMTERDAAWMARIIARFGDEHLKRLIRTARMGNVSLESELLRVLIGRRDKLLRRYLTRLSPLTNPTLENGQLCLEDRAIEGGVVRREGRMYGARAFIGYGSKPGDLSLGWSATGTICADVSAVLVGAGQSARRAAAANETGYAMVDFFTGDRHRVNPNPARVHLRSLKGAFRVVGLERPKGPDPPG